MDKENGTITLNQEKYIDELLLTFNISDCKFADTPIEPKLSSLM